MSASPAGRRGGREAALVALAALSACVAAEARDPAALPQTDTRQPAAAPVSGPIGTVSVAPPAPVEIGAALPPPPPPVVPPAGRYALDFTDADLRDVAARILGGMLGMTTQIDPEVHGTVTLRTTRPVTGAELLTMLRSLLFRNGMALVASGPMLRVMPAASAGAAGSRVVALQFVAAQELAKVLQPLAGSNAKVVAEPGFNALVLYGDPAQIDALEELVRSFDVDALAGQSYALLPVAAGSAGDVAEALEQALHGDNSGLLAGLVRVVPLKQLGLVLVVAAQRRSLEAARKIFAMIERQRRASTRAWSVHYVRNSAADTVAATLQLAFTPNCVTSVPAPQQRGLPAGLGQVGLAQVTAGTTSVDAMRILPNPQNNAVLIFATAQEEETVVAMLRKIDILPLQVRIDATIAEVTLNDQLQYGTQFFFRAGGINGMLNYATAANIATTLANTPLSTSFPGFVIGGTGVAGGPAAISALQAVTTVTVLSSPQLMVVDNQPARLQVGSLVPYLQSQQQSTLVANATLVNSVGYQPTGVILEVTPRINSGGLVTLDISQEVSQVDASATTTSGISSPQFLERSVTSRVVVQDGQTIGLAGLISDNVSRGNQGIPWLKDIPLLGALASQQNNNRTRTELLVLITPHVIRDQRDARALAEDMRESLHGAATAPATLSRLAPTGSDDPNAKLRDRVPQLGRSVTDALVENRSKKTKKSFCCFFQKAGRI